MTTIVEQREQALEKCVNKVQRYEILLDNARSELSRRERTLAAAKHAAENPKPKKVAGGKSSSWKTALRNSEHCLAYFVERGEKEFEETMRKIIENLKKNTLEENDSVEEESVDQEISDP